MASKVIALVDCDSFFVSCEQLLMPELIGKPVCVLSNNDGCVIARSKEAKKLGIKMGMPAFLARTEFPQGVYLSGRIGFYGEISNRVMSVIAEFTPTVEIYSIDEAFIDLTGLRRLYKKDYAEIAKELKSEIKRKIGIPVSIGISLSKTLAKLATERAKQNDGVYTIGFRKIFYELQKTEVSQIWGIGNNTSSYLKKYDIFTAYELTLQTDNWLKKHLGKIGLDIKNELLGNSVYEISCNLGASGSLPKSIQKTSSFAKFTSDEQYIKNSINFHIHRACKKLRKLGLKTSVASLMLRTKDFKVLALKKNLIKPTDWEFDIYKAVDEMFHEMYNPRIIYRSSGIVLAGFHEDADNQLSFFSSVEDEYKKENLAFVWDKLEAKYGRNIVYAGGQNL